MFRIEQRLGEGGFGRVFRVRDVERARSVALKTLLHLDAQSLSRIREEFRTVSSASHPNVVRFHELGRHGSIPFYTMELVDGARFLNSAATTRAALDAETMAPETGQAADTSGLPLDDWLQQLADAIEALHAQGLLHLDIKPANLMVSRSGQIILVDFGLASRVESDGTTLAPRHGTAPYCAPEHLAGRAVARAADWYSAGATFAHALSGVPPRPGGATERELEALSGLGALGRVCVRLMAPDPARRGNADFIRSALGGSRLRTASSRPQATGAGTRGTPSAGDLGWLWETQGDDAPRHDLSLVVGSSRSRSLLLGAFGAGLAERGVPHLATSAREWEMAPFGVLEGLLAGRDFSLGSPASRSEAVPARDSLTALAGDLHAWLGSFAAGRRVVVSIDDFHWCDRDSAALLTRLMLPNPGYHLHVVLGYRDGDRRWEALGEIRRWVDELPLALRWQERVLTSEPDEDATACGAEDALESIPESARRYLELLSLAGGPTPQDAMRRAIGPASEQEALSTLRALGHVTTSGPRLSDDVEVSSSLLAQAIRDTLPPTGRRRMHLELAKALRACGSSAAAEMARQYGAAGLPSVASGFALAAADQARGRLAYQRAAQLYRTALDWGNLALPERRRILVDLSRCLGASGRGREAAAARLEAADLEDAREARASRSFAAEQLLISGHPREGIAEVSRLGRELQLRYPRGLVAAALGIAGALLAEALGPSSRRRGEDAEEAAEFALAAFRGLMPVDPPRAGYFAARGLRLARSSGSKALTGTALVSLASGLLAPAGGPFARWGDRLLNEAEALSRDAGDAELRARVDLARSTIAFWRGRWGDAHDFASRAAAALDRSEAPSSFDRNILNLVLSRSLEELGRWNEAARRTGWMLSDALARDDRYALVTASLNHGMIAIARNAPDEAIDCARRALERWAEPGLQVQHVYALRLEAYAELYRGNAERAWELLASRWKEIRSGMHLRIPAARVDLQLLRGRLALALGAREPGTGGDWQALAEGCARDLERLGRSDAGSHAQCIRAGIARARGDAPEASRRLAIAEEGFRKEGLSAMAEACAALHGAGPERADAFERLRELGVTEPERWARCLVPS